MGQKWPSQLQNNVPNIKGIATPETPRISYASTAYRFRWRKIQYHRQWKTTDNHIWTYSNWLNISDISLENDPWTCLDWLSISDASKHNYPSSCQCSWLTISPWSTKNHSQTSLNTPGTSIPNTSISDSSTHSTSITNTSISATSNFNTRSHNTSIPISTVSTLTTSWTWSQVIWNASKTSQDCFGQTRHIYQQTCKCSTVCI